MFVPFAFMVGLIARRRVIAALTLIAVPAMIELWCQAVGILMTSTAMPSFRSVFIAL